MSSTDLSETASEYGPTGEVVSTPAMPSSEDAGVVFAELRMQLHTCKLYLVNGALLGIDLIQSSTSRVVRQSSLHQPFSGTVMIGLENVVSVTLCPRLVLQMACLSLRCRASTLSL